MLLILGIIHVYLRVVLWSEILNKVYTLNCEGQYEKNNFNYFSWILHKSKTNVFDSERKKRYSLVLLAKDSRQFIYLILIISFVFSIIGYIFSFDC